MTTASTSSGNTPMSDYFSFQPLLGGDPLLTDVDGGVDTAWDADLQPDEYGDQSSWDDDNASFTDSEYEDDDDDSNNDDKVGNDDKDEEEEWSIVYAASITVVACSSSGSATTMTTCQGVQDNEEEEKCEMHLAALSHGPPPANPLQRRDSKVHFCEEPPEVVSYEQCSREDYPELYYSVHELQKIIDELRVETNKKTIVNATTSTTTTATTGSKKTTSSSSGQPPATTKTASKVGSMTPSRST